MTSELVPMIWKLLYIPTSAENAKYVSKIGSKFVHKLRFSFLLCCLCLRLHQKIPVFADNQLSSWEALTSFSLKIQIVEYLVYIAPQMLRRLDSSGRNLTQKWWFFFLLKCQKDCGFILIFFHIRGRKGKDAFGFGNTQEEKCWSLMKHDWKCHVLSVWRSIRRYTRCFDWRLNPSKHNLLSSNEGRVSWYCWRVLELNEVHYID